MERSLGVSVLGLVAGEVPDDQGLVSAGGQEHVGAGGRLVSRVQAGRQTDSGLQGGTYFSIEVAKLVTQPFCIAMLAARFPLSVVSRGTYVALEGALEDQLFSHCSG